MGQRAAKLLPMALACIAVSLSPCAVFAQNVDPFTFNFTPLPTGERHTYAHIFCGIEGELKHNCSLNASAEVQAATPIPQNQRFWAGAMGNDIETRFVQEIVEINGVEYYHLIVGEPESGFAQEIYIARSNLAFRDREGGVFSDSGGVACFMYDNGSTPSAEIDACLLSNSSADPLRRDSTFTGNGTGNPSKMVMKQTISNDADGFSQEFLKANLAFKPVITQISTDSDINALFVMDMSNSDYNTDDTPGAMINTFNLTAPNLADDLGDFVFTPTEGTNITAGRYTFTRTMVLDYELGNGELVDVPSSEYVYYDGTVDPVLNVDWAAFRDPGQNSHSVK